ncbi:hypothetical protein ACFL6W_02250 [Thermodesulfobacteriota bacterium]
MTSKEKEPVIKVDCYSGYRADERPASFVSGEKKLRIDRIIKQWRSPDFNYFKVQADDGKGYILKNDIVRGGWVLEKVFEL